MGGIVDLYNELHINNPYPKFLLAGHDSDKSLEVNSTLGPTASPQDVTTRSRNSFIALSYPPHQFPAGNILTYHHIGSYTIHTCRHNQRFAWTQYLTELPCMHAPSIYRGCA